MKHAMLLAIVALVWNNAGAQADDTQEKYSGSQYQDEINAEQAEQDAEANDPVRIHLSNASDAASSAFSFAEQAVQGIQDALDELTNLHEGDTKDVLQYYADKAKQKMSDVIANAKQAADNAETAQYEADQAGCGDASGSAQNAADQFNSAKEILNSANSSLRDATGDEDADILVKYLTAAYNNLNDGAKALTTGAESLNGVSDGIKSCE